VKQITLFILLFFAGFTKGQNIPVKIFYSTDWKITEPKLFRYYRVCSWNTESQFFEGSFTDYSIGNKKVCEGNYLEGSLNGPIRYYNEDEKNYRTSFFSSGKMDSVHYFRYSDKGKRSVIQSILIDKESFSVRTFTDSVGNQLIVNGTGLWYTNQPGNTVLEGRFENGKKAGTWRYRRKNGQIILMESYRKGKLKDAQFYSSNGTEELSSSSFTSALFEDQILKRVNSLDFDIHASRGIYPQLAFLPEMAISEYTENKELKSKGEFTEAQYPGNDQSLGFLLSRNLRYPEAERRKGIEGLVYVGFIIQENGVATDFEILKGLSPRCDEEAIRVLGLMDTWTPATLNGERVASRRVIPITFRLATR